MTVRAEHMGGDRYRVRVYMGTDPATGKPIQRARYFRAKNQRAANAAASEHDLALRDVQKAAKANRGTVNELVDRWVRHRRNDSPSTIARRASIVATIKRDLGSVRLADLKTWQIDEWYHQLREETPTRKGQRARSESTVHHYHRVLHAILQQGYVWDMIDRTPAAKVTKPKHQTHKKPTAPPPATITLLIQSAPPDLAVAARLLAATGLRRGELAALRWTDIDLDAESLFVSRSLVGLKSGVIEKAPKNVESIRHVALDAETVYVLDMHRRRIRREMPELADDAYLFPAPLTADRTGRTPRHPDWFTRSWARLCKQHGAHIRLHDLRHMHATTLLDMGTPIHTVQHRLGHAKASTTTDIYGHPVGDSDINAARSIGTALSKGTP